MPHRRRKSLAALSIAALSANAGLVSGFQSVNSNHGMPKSYASRHCAKQNSCAPGSIVIGGQQHSFLPPSASALHISTPSASSVGGGEADINSGTVSPGSDVSHHQQQHQGLDIAATSAASDSVSKDEKKKKTSKKNKVQHAQNEITSADKAVLWTTVAGIVAAFAAVTQVSGPGAWKYYVAGGICAAFSHGITTPIDVVKVCSSIDLSWDVFFCRNKYLVLIFLPR